jgi:hypothetical protein
VFSFGPKRFKVVTTGNYPWMYTVLDTFEGVVVPDSTHLSGKSRHLYKSLAKGEARELNKLHRQKVSFAWEKK